MPKAIKYAIFPTKWGYFGLAGTEYALLRTHLPLTEREKVKCRLLKDLPLVNRGLRLSTAECPSLVRRSFGEGGRIEFDKALFKPLQKQITAYFEGTCPEPYGSRAYVNFGRGISLDLTGLTRFTKLVLAGCRDITFGQTTSYGRLAEKIGRANAARAVGRALAKNPLPLIIPCHRVVCANGRVGGFSAVGGSDLKEELLRHERKAKKV